MASAWARTRARERIAALGAAGLGDRDLRRQVLAVLRDVIDFDAYVWLLTDPVTAVGAAPLADVPCITELPALIKAKYATPVNRWTALQLQTCPAGLLNDAVGGASRWRFLAHFAGRQTLLRREARRVGRPRRYPRRDY